MQVLSAAWKLDPLKGKLDPVQMMLNKNNSPTPVAPTAITPPPPDAGTTDQGANVQAQSDLLLQRQGRAANLLTSSQGVSSTPTGTKALLGQ